MLSNINNEHTAFDEWFVTYNFICKWNALQDCTTWKLLLCKLYSSNNVRFE